MNTVEQALRAKLESPRDAQIRTLMTNRVSIMPERLASKISPRRKDYLVRLCDEETCFDLFEEEQDGAEAETVRSRIMHDFLAGCSDSLELQFFAECILVHGEEELVWLELLLNSRECELATALFIFWRNGGVYYQRFALIEEAAPHERPFYRFLRDVEAKVLNGDFFVGRLSFSPLQFGAALRYQAQWQPNEVLFRAVDGAIPTG